MSSEEIKQQVLDWIADGCNYEAGVALYTAYGKNVMLKRDFPNHKMRYSTKIVYELCKSVGLEYGQLLVDKKIVVAPTPMTVCINQMKINTVTNSIDDLPEAIEVKRVTEYPAIIRRVIVEYAESFQERSKAHRIMTEMPEGNSQALKTKREQLFGIVKSLSDRLQLLYDVQEVYKKTGFVPDESEIWPTPKEKAKTELPDDADLLRKMKKNQQSANTKDQSLLDYQSEKQGTVKKPMPNGPKRMKLENRIKARLKMIEEIDYKLLK
jgi:hypothetical protein